MSPFTNDRMWLLISVLQLMTENIEDLLALLSELVAGTLRNEDEQTTENLRLIADILEVITERILELNVNVTESVSFQHD